MVFVTHDQTEAMTLASRIVVMNNRRVEQIGTPMDVYSRPATRFVAAFVGSPAMNFLPVSGLGDSDGQAVVEAGGARVQTHIATSRLPGRDGLTLGVRPEALKVVGEGGAFAGVVELLERLGDRTLVHVRLADGQLVVAEDIGKSALEPGAPVSLAADPSETHLFAADGEAYHAA